MEIISNYKEHIARKEHICEWCLLKINKKEKYLRSVYKDEGDLLVWKTHESCLKLLDILNMDEFHEGVSSQDFRTYIEEFFQKISNENVSFEEKLKKIREYLNL